MRLYFADVSALDPNDFAGILTDYRREKLSRQRDAQSRRQGLGAELLLRRALADCAPECLWPPEIRLGEYGKPAWNVEGLYFNLSHSGEFAACVIADCPVGLDVQEACVYREALAHLGDEGELSQSAGEGPCAPAVILLRRWRGERQA